MVTASPQQPGSGVMADITPSLAFDERAVFVAGPARSGTTLLTALLDGHPDLLVLPEETAYFPTILTKYGTCNRREQFDYLTTGTLANVLFGGACKWGRRDYSHFPTTRLREEFARRAFNPANARRDLLVLLLETYADVLDRPRDSIRHWVEKTPANRDHLDAIYQRFPHARVLLTLRDPRALLASQIQLERTRRLRRFSAYLVTQHWLNVARRAIQHRSQPDPTRPMEIVEYRHLLTEPARVLRRVCSFLEVPYSPVVLTPTKVGLPWSGNSSAGETFSAISQMPGDRWRQLLTPSEIGWIEWHCCEAMEHVGYKPLFSRRQLRNWVTPLRGETPREYLKSRFYSVFGKAGHRRRILREHNALAAALPNSVQTT